MLDVSNEWRFPKLLKLNSSSFTSCAGIIVERTAHGRARLALANVILASQVAYATFTTADSAATRAVRHTCSHHMPKVVGQIVTAGIQSHM